MKEAGIPKSDLMIFIPSQRGENIIHWITGSVFFFPPFLILTLGGCSTQQWHGLARAARRHSCTLKSGQMLDGDGEMSLAGRKRPRMP